MVIMGGRTESFRSGGWLSQCCCNVIRETSRAHCDAPAAPFTGKHLSAVVMQVMAMIAFKKDLL